MSKFLLIDMRTGLMDGLYATHESCLEAIETLEERYQTSFWRVFEMYDDGRDFNGTFPPDHLFHHFVEEAIKQQDDERAVH